MLPAVGRQLRLPTMLDAAAAAAAGAGPALAGRSATTATAAAPSASAARGWSSLVFAAPGEPLDVLELQQQDAPPGPLAPGDVRLRLIAAPINPSDVNTVQGKYPLSPPLPGVPGHEGVLRVEEVGSEVKSLRAGDRVVPLASALGTWRSGGVFRASDWHAVPPGLEDAAAATMCINPPTALCMLENFVSLKEGDTVVQNGATSAVGQHVIQLCKARGIRTINIIRDRPDWDATVAWLQGMGADVVTKEADVKQAAASAGFAPPALGLNCVGGSAALAVAKLLRPGGTVVTYGAMALQPVTLPASLLIFKDLSFRGFWLSGGWAAKEGPGGRAKLLDKVAAAFQDGSMKPPRLLTFPLAQWREAFEANATAHRNAKVALVPE